MLTKNKTKQHNTVKNAFHISQKPTKSFNKNIFSWFLNVSTESKTT